MILSEWGQLATRRALPFGDTPPCYVVRQDIPPECVTITTIPSGSSTPIEVIAPTFNALLSCEVCC
jgi:hypothetical protein